MSVRIRLTRLEKHHAMKGNTEEIPESLSAFEKYKMLLEEVAPNV